MVIVHNKIKALLCLFKETKFKKKRHNSLVENLLRAKAGLLPKTDVSLNSKASVFIFAIRQITVKAFGLQV